MTEFSYHVHYVCHIYALQNVYTVEPAYVVICANEHVFKGSPVVSSHFFFCFPWVTP